MKVLLSRLKQYIDLPESPQEIAQMLTNSGIEVDAVEEFLPTFKGVIVGRVTKATKHPEADRLTIAEVFDGKKTLTLICGAPNCREGIFVALAPSGATLFPDGPEKPPLEIKKTTIRGVESNGMLCSEKELGISGESNSIIELTAVREGEDFASKLIDVAFTLSLTPNLGHAMSVLGIARELAAITGRKLKAQPWQKAPSLSKDLSIAIKTDECKRYSALMIQNIRVTSSPFWLKLQLERSGMRSINTIVDITNWIAHEIGQPLHAYDRKTIQGNTIEVRVSKPTESMTLLDDTTKVLPQETVVITDQKHPIAIGGVMGSKATSVTLSSTDVLFESAYFTPASIRRSSRKLQVMSDSSKRFERGTDPTSTVLALRAVQEIIAACFPESHVVGFYDLATEKFPPREIICRKSRAEKILGSEVSANDMEMVFTRINASGKWMDSDRYRTQVPPYRHDLKEEIDLIDEILRLTIITKPEELAPRSYIGSTLPNNALYLFSKKINRRLLAERLQEFITCNLISPKMVDMVRNHPIDATSLVRVLHPMSEEQSILRPSLLPGLLDVIKRNCNQRNFDVAGFEIGNVHFKRDGKYSEQPVVGVILAGSAKPPYFDTAARQFDFLDLKGIIENLMRSIGVASLNFEPSKIAIFHSGRQAKIFSSSLQIGTIGELHPAILRKLDIPVPVIFAEFNIQDLMQLPKIENYFEMLPEYPGSERDWTITLPQIIPHRQIIEAIYSARSKLLEKIELVSIYHSEKLGADRQNVTLRFVYRDRKRTIEQAEVDQEHARLIGIATQAFQK